MSKKTAYYCNLCNCEVGEKDNGYGYEVYLNLRRGTDFIDRTVDENISNASIHICKECVEKVIESVFNQRVDKNAKYAVCPNCGSKVVSGYSVKYREHRFYCCNCHGNFSPIEVKDAEVPEKNT